MIKTIDHGFNYYCYEWSTQWGKWAWPSHLFFVLAELLRPSNPRGSQWPLGPWHQCLINANAISIFINKLLAVHDPSMTPCYLNWARCYFMIKLMMWSKAWNQSRSHKWTSNYWITCQTLLGTSIYHRRSMSAGSKHHPMQIVIVDGHCHQRPDTIIVIFVTIQFKVMADPLAQP